MQQASKMVSGETNVPKPSKSRSKSKRRSSKTSASNSASSASDARHWEFGGPMEPGLLCGVYPW